MLSCSYSTRWVVIGWASRPAVGCSYVGVFPGLFPYGRHPRFRDFDPVVPVDVRVEVDLDRFLDSASVSVSSLSMHLTLFQLGPCLVVLACSATYRSDSALGVHLSRAPSSGVPVQERMKEHERDVHLVHLSDLCGSGTYQRKRTMAQAGMMSRALTEIHTGSLAESRRSRSASTLTTSTGTMGSKSLKRGCRPYGNTPGNTPT